MPDVDVLFITHRRADYTRRTLPHLLDTCTGDMRVWVWHNGEDAETLDVVREHLDHPRVHRFHHSRDNKRLTAPTNWMWSQADGAFVSKVDDDCLVQPGWAETLARAHGDHAPFGVLGSWRFYPDDFDATLAEPKIRSYPGGHTLLRNLWVQGSGYLMKRDCVDARGLLRPGESFTRYCIGLEQTAGRVNGWYYPFIHEEHLDDPRSPHTGLRTDADLRAALPLSAAARGITTLSDWEAQMRRSARELQAASLDPRDHVGWRRRLRALRDRARRLVRRTGGRA